MGMFGDVFSGLMGAGMQIGQMAFDANQADKNRDMQRYFAKNAHQIEVEDLKKAGLNPVLSAGGGGSSMPSGSSASAPDFDNPVSSAADIAIKKATEKNLVAQNKKLAAETAATAADARRIGAMADKEEITKLPYTMIRDHLLPRIKSSAEDVSDQIKKSGISIKMGKGDFQ